MTRIESSPDSGSGIFGGPTSYGDPGLSRFVRSAFLAAAGYDETDIERPIVGIGHSISDFTPCHREMPALLESAKRGVLQAGGVPFAFPTMSLGELFLSPTSMMWRNLLALEVEELILAQPMDAVLMLGGCDKTVPGQLMGAISADRPCLMAVAGPMQSGMWQGQRVGACTDCRRMWAAHRAGELSAESLPAASRVLAPTGGTCMVMGTASTMAVMVEVLGLAIPGSATAPAPTGDRLRVGVASGRRIVDMIAQALTPCQMLTKAGFLNAGVVLGAIGGSTNALIHLLAMAGRAGVELSLDELASAAGRAPVLVDCRPVGEGFLGDLHDVGGVPALLVELGDLVDLDAPTAMGTSLGETLDGLAGAPEYSSVLRTLENPVSDPGSLVVLRGSLAPDGAVLKVGAATPELCDHTGPALVFEGVEDMQQRIEHVPATASSVLIMRGCGPIGAAMPEAGAIPIPRKLAETGVSDMVRISDARMSGTAFGTVVLHVAPESAAGGPLGLVRDGDLVRVDVAERRLDLLVDGDELTRRAATSQVTGGPSLTGVTRWRRLQAGLVGQADQGADLPDDPTGLANQR